MVAAEDTARHKPEPDVFLEAARRLNVDPAVCTVYEDTDIGLEAARRAGMIPVDVRESDQQGTPKGFPGPPAMSSGRRSRPALYAIKSSA